MTLILTIANSRGTYQSSDYQLTSPTGEPVSDKPGSKQLEATLTSLNVQLAFTGVAKISSGRRTMDWLLLELKALGPDSDLQSICDALAARCTAEMNQLQPRGVLTLVLTAAAPGNPFRVGIISNSQWGEDPPKAAASFQVKIHSIKKPFRLISGFRQAVRVRERQRLNALARDPEKTPQQMLEALAEINALAAQNGRGYISTGCWTASQYADGKQLRRIESRSIGEEQGSVPHLFAGIDLLDYIKKNYRLAPDQPLQIKPLGGVIMGPGGGTPLPPPEGEKRDFKLSAPPVEGILRSPTGEHCASIRVTQREIIISTRRNEQITTPFAQIELSNISKCEDFPRPLYPWPQISLPFSVGDADVPRGWEISIGNWVEDGRHHIFVQQTSRGIRNLAFLGDDDELVIVVKECQLLLEPAQEKRVATLTADVLWRVRLDGTKG